jgi:trafficking protein particle complex subunit 9
LSKSYVNYLDITFHDSTTPILNDALSSTLLAEDERSELEYFLYERPAFVWAQPSRVMPHVEANRSEDVYIQVNGKRGLTRGVITIDYAFTSLHSQNPGLPRRHLDMSLAITVNASVDLLSCDFWPFFTDIDLSPAGTRLFSRSKSTTKFFLVLEMRNSWIDPLRLALSVTSANESQTVPQLLQSGQTRRIVILLNRILLPATKTETVPPPKMRDRQFVVSNSDQSRIIAAREAWWYRQQILDCLSGTWAEQSSGGRTGNVEMRGIRLSDRHIRVVQRSTVEAAMSIISLGTSLDRAWSVRLTVDVRNSQGNDF